MYIKKNGFTLKQLYGSITSTFNFYSQYLLYHCFFMLLDNIYGSGRGGLREYLREYF